MNVRAAAIAATATAALALAGLGAGPAFADNHISVAPQDRVQGKTYGEQGPQYLQGDQGPQFLHMTDGAYEH